DAVERRQGVRDVGYGIRDTWVDPAEAVPAIAPITVGERMLRIVGTDKTNITRKPSKTGKHEHGKRKSTKEAKDAKPKPGKVKKSKLWDSTQWQGQKRHLKASHWLILLRKHTWMKESTREGVNLHYKYSERKHKCLTTDCHAGNPCDPKERSNGSKSLPND
ncbi:hypothetical protein Tco_1421756, partial [Tanacetum coccineum]